jgi:hypothetical protein
MSAEKISTWILLGLELDSKFLIIMDKLLLVKIIESTGALPFSPKPNTGTRQAPFRRATLINPKRFFKTKSILFGKAYKDSAAPPIIVMQIQHQILIICYTMESGLLYLERA